MIGSEAANAAEVIRARQAEQFAGWRFVHEGDELLTLAPADLVPKLISRASELVPVAQLVALLSGR